MFITPPPIMPTNLIAGCIAEFENIWVDTKKIIRNLEKEEKKLPPRLKFESAYEISHKDASPLKNNSRRTNANLSLTKAGGVNDYFRETNNQYYLSVFSATQWYAEYFGIPELYHSEDYVLLRYQTGQEYKAHFDGGLIDKRAVSPILYLNDDYEGGELEFVHFGIKIKPKKGTLYLFPSNYAYSHIAHPVTNGTKYAIVTWLHGAIQ